MTEQEAQKLLNDCFVEMFFRDKKGHDLVQVSTVTHAGGVKFGEPYKINASSDFEFFRTHTNEFFRPMRIRY